jgi:isochorismate synthase
MHCNMAGTSDTLLSLTSLAGNGWVLYRLPGSKEVVFTTGPVIDSVIHNHLDPGFIIAQFNAYNRVKLIKNKHSYKWAEASEIDHDIQLAFYHKKERNHASNKEHYCDLVRSVLNDIAAGHLRKAVPARTKYVQLDSNFSPIHYYRLLLEAYPHAFVYLLSSSATGTWIGCSPEVLFHADHQAITTLSLAGTRKMAASGKQLPGEAFKGKEYEEQGIVTEYISLILQKYCNDIVIHGPGLQQAGNILHLATDFKATLKPEYQSAYGTLVKELHPTPAVCGYPTLQAKAFLHQNEDFDRELYSGYLGTVTETSADLFVNLRSMQLFKNSATLYAGAGIIQGSDPEKEWMETEEKMETLLRYLR